MDNFTLMNGDSLFLESITNIVNNDKTVLSNSAGTKFPTDNLYEGRTYFDVNKGIEYVYGSNNKWTALTMLKSKKTVDNEIYDFANGTFDGGKSGYFILSAQNCTLLQYGLCGMTDDETVEVTKSDGTKVSKNKRRMYKATFGIPFASKPSVMTNSPYVMGGSEYFTYGNHNYEEFINYKKAFGKFVTLDNNGFTYDLLYWDSAEKRNKRALEYIDYDGFLGREMYWMAIGKVNYSDMISILSK